MQTESQFLQPEVLLKDSFKSPSKHGNEIATLLANANILILNNERDLAAHLLRKALYLNSTHVESLKKLSLCLSSDKDSSLKIRVLKELSLREPTFENKVRYANSLYNSELYSESKEVYFDSLNTLQESHPLMFEVYKNLGNIFLRDGDMDATEEFYNKAYVMNQNSDVLLVNMGTLAFQVEDFNVALERYRQALELNSKNDKAWVGLALAHYKMGDLVLAQANLESALDVNYLNRTAVHLAADWGLREKNYKFVSETLINYVSGVEYDEDISLLLIHTFCLDGKIFEAGLELERMLLWDPCNEKLHQIEKELKGI